jgi:hypothetical protein
MPALSSSVTQRHLDETWMDRIRKPRKDLLDNKLQGQYAKKHSKNQEEDQSSTGESSRGLIAVYFGDILPVPHGFVFLDLCVFLLF